jgi:hypothetical protein
MGGFWMRSEADWNDLSGVSDAGSGHNSEPTNNQQTEETPEEQRKIRRLQLMMNLVMSVIAQDKHLTVDQAAEIVASSKKAALDMFPDKELAYNMIYKPRLQRLMRERFRIQ